MVMLPNGVMMGFEEFARNARSALNLFLEKNKLLFENNLYEETINHQLACELSNLFSDYDVDCEYTHNTPSDDLKRDDSRKIVRPDIIIHKRGNHSSNLGIVKVKKYKNSRSDKKKIEKYSQLGYDYGVTVKFTSDGYVNRNSTKIYNFRTREWKPLY